MAFPAGRSVCRKWQKLLFFAPGCRTNCFNIKIEMSWHQHDRPPLYYIRKLTGHSVASLPEMFGGNPRNCHNPVIGMKIVSVTSDRLFFFSEYSVLDPHQ